MISFLVGECGFGPSPLPANGSGGDGHVSFFFFFCSRMDVVHSSKADGFLMSDPLGTAPNLPPGTVTCLAGNPFERELS